MLAGKRIIFVLGNLELGGAERQAVLLAHALRERAGADARVWGLGPPARASALCDSMSVPWHSTSFELSGNPFRDLGRLARFAELLRGTAPEVLMPYTWFPNVLCGLVWRASGAGCCIWNQRDAGLFLDPGRAAHRLAAWLTPFFLSNSAHAAAYLTRSFRVDHGRLAVIANGVRLDAPKEDRLSWRRRLGAAEGDLVGCMVANFSDLKDHATAVRGWRLVVDRMALSDRRAVLALAGRYDGTECRIRSLISELDLEGEVRVVGPVDDVAGLLSACDLGVHCAQQEGCPNAVLEQMAAGLAVVATDNEGVRLALGEGSEALLAQQGDWEGLARQILSVARGGDYRRKIGSSNRQRVLDHFSVDAMCRDTVAFLEHALKDRSA